MQCSAFWKGSSAAVYCAMTRRLSANRVRARQRGKMQLPRLRFGPAAEPDGGGCGKVRADNDAKLHLGYCIPQEILGVEKEQKIQILTGEKRRFL